MSSEIQHHPELEDLAAFADGRLPRAERIEIQAHIAGCEACYEVVSEVLYLTAEPEEEVEDAPADAPAMPRPANENKPRNRVRRHGERPAERPGERPGVVPLRQSSWRWPAAAAVAAVLTAVLLWHPWSAPRQPDAVLLAALPASSPEWSTRLGAEWTSGVVPENRGFDDETVSRAPFYRAGLRLVQLEVALQAGDLELAGTLARQIQNDLDLAGMIGLPREFSVLGERIAAVQELKGDAPIDNAVREELLLQARESAAFFSEPRIAESPESRHFLLGRWVEATRVAATVGIVDDFARRLRRDLDRFLADELDGELADELAEPIREELRVIQEEFAGDRDPERIVAACQQVHNLAGRL